MGEKLGLNMTILLIFLAGIGVLSAVALGLMTLIAWAGGNIAFGLSFMIAVALALTAIIAYINGAKEVDADDNY